MNFAIGWCQWGAWLGPNQMQCKIGWYGGQSHDCSHRVVSEDPCICIYILLQLKLFLIHWSIIYSRHFVHIYLPYVLFHHNDQHNIYTGYIMLDIHIKRILYNFLPSRSRLTYSILCDFVGSRWPAIREAFTSWPSDYTWLVMTVANFSLYTQYSWLWVTGSIDMMRLHVSCVLK